MTLHIIKLLVEDLVSNGIEIKNLLWHKISEDMKKAALDKAMFDLQSQNINVEEAQVELRLSRALNDYKHSM